MDDDSLDGLSSDGGGRSRGASPLPLVYPSVGSKSLIKVALAGMSSVAEAELQADVLELRPLGYFKLR